MLKNNHNLNLNDGSISFFKDKDQWLRQFKECGISIEHSLLSDDFCSRLVNEVNSTNSLETYTPIMMAHRKNDMFLEFLNHPKIITILKDLMKESFSGLQTQFFFGSPGTKGFSDHQDNHWIQASRPDKFISVWIALCDVNPNNGGIYFWLGSHFLGDLEVESIEENAGSNQFSNAREKQSIIPQGSKVLKQDAYLSKGSVAFFHSRTVHGSYTNKSNKFRYALLNTYIADECNFRSGFHAKRERIKLN